MSCHFYDVLPAFEDKRYVTVDGKPFFLIFAPAEIPGFKGVYRLLATFGCPEWFNGYSFCRSYVSTK